MDAHLKGFHCDISLKRDLCIQNNVIFLLIKFSLVFSTEYSPHMKLKTFIITIPCSPIPNVPRRNATV